MSSGIRNHSGGCLRQPARRPCSHPTAAPLQPAWAVCEHSVASQRHSQHGSCQGYTLRKLGRTSAAFTYEPEAAEISREATMEEYLELKQFLLRRTQRSAGFVTVYLLLTVSGEAALCAALGGMAGYAYVAWLCADVDRISPNDEVPMVRANNIRDAWPRRFARVVAGIRQQLQPRLLVPVALGAAVWTFNTQSGDQLTLTEQGSLLAGFFSFKIAHGLLLYRELRPKFDSEVQTRRIPKMDDIEDVSFDIYARGTQKLKAIEDADRVLEEEAEKKRKR
eukprot:jgi/Ulvmu1/1451/UM011_0181.1